jgi:GTPase
MGFVPEIRKYIIKSRKGNTMTASTAPQKESVAIHQARGQFLHSFSLLQQEFDAVQRRARQQEQHLLLDQEQVAKTLEQQVNAVQGKLADDQPVGQLCHKWLQDIRQVTGQWLQAAQQFDKGTQLNDQCKGSFVAYVLGKVNAGKSSLGNYIATGQHQPSSERITALKAHDLNFVLHEQSNVNTQKKQSLEQGFVVDDQECTSSIQYFSLPGLTWVDVPGLHSKNAANGELAAEYLQSADLVVYVMNAEHPARETDMAEIRHLLDMEKPLVFVLTCSDEMLQDEVDGQLVCQRTMYSRQDRHAQNQYLLETLQRHFGDHPGLKTGTCC